MKILNDGSIGPPNWKRSLEDGYPGKPHLTFTGLFRRTKQIHPRISRKTFTERLSKLQDTRDAITYSSNSGNHSKLARNNPKFYRINPETSGELIRRKDIHYISQPEDNERKRKEDKSFYKKILSRYNLLGIVYMNFYTTFEIQVRVTGKR